MYNAQGKRGIWFLGSAASLESTQDVMEYNKLLLRNMKPLTC